MHYLVHYPSSPGRWLLSSIYLSYREARLRFQPSLQDHPHTASVQQGPAGQRVSGRLQGVQDGLGSAFRRVSPHLWSVACGDYGGLRSFGATVFSEELVATILHLPSPHHLPRSPFLRVTSLFKLAQPRFHCSRLLLPVADNG